VVKTFRATIIYVKRFLDIRVLIYIRLRDLLPKGKSIDNISVDKCWNIWTGIYGQTLRGYVLLISHPYGD
jgi:hypothetical protein